MALYREFEMTVGPGTGAGVSLETGSLSIVVSGLDCSFSIMRSNELAENKGKFKIYNATEDTRQKIMKRENNVQVRAGYTDEKNKALIFAGAVESAISYRDNSDWVTELTCATYKGEDSKPSSKLLSLSYEKDTLLSTVVQDLAAVLGLSILGIENIAGYTLPNGFNFLNTAQALMEYCADFAFTEGINIVIDNQDLLIYTIGVPSRISSTVLDYNTSLLKVQEKVENQQFQSLRKGPITPKKIVNMVTLLDPKLIPQSTVQLDVPGYQGSYLINSVNFYGDNFGGDFNCKVKAVSID